MPTNGRAPAGPALATPLPGWGVACARLSGCRKVTVSWVFAAPALGLRKTAFVNSRARLADSVAAFAHSSSLSLCAVTALRDSGQSFQAQTKTYQFLHSSLATTTTTTTTRGS